MVAFIFLFKESWILHFMAGFTTLFFIFWLEGVLFPPFLEGAERLENHVLDNSSAYRYDGRCNGAKPEALCH